MTRSAALLTTNFAVLVLCTLPCLTAHAQQSPEQELACLRAAEGIEISLFAAEPLVTNPAAIDVDTHGRVWVAEIEFYRKFANEPPRDRIKVLEDTDGDGRADKSTVFADGVYNPMSICVAWPKVYVATSPDLWVYEDQNNDLKADGPPQKLLTGFGGYNHDHGAHSLVLGPDHKWWMSHGDGGFDVQGNDGSHVKFKWGGLLRGELDGTRLELVAQNFRNPYEVGVSSFGEAILSDNDNDGNQSARICWIMPGGDYGWFGGPPHRVPQGTPRAESWHFRGHIPGHVPATIVTGFGSPCGLCYYEGGAFGDALNNVPWHCDPGPREVRVYPHQPDGFGMQGQSRAVVTSHGDDYFRPSDICAAPDGSLLLSDWYDGGVGGHAYNNPNQGRIFALRPQGTKLERRDAPGPYAELSAALTALASPNLATRHLARERILAAKAEAIEPLRELAATAADPTLKARALWLLDRLGVAGRPSVVEQLGSDDPKFRALAVRILGRRVRQHADLILAAHADVDPQVRREAVLAMRQLGSAEAEAAIVEIASQYDGSDRYLVEAVNIALGDNAERRARVLAALEKRQGWDARRLPLLQVLAPQRAVEVLASELQRRPKRTDAELTESLYKLAGIPSLSAASLAWQTAVSLDHGPAVRRVAWEIAAANLNGQWRELSREEQFVSSLSALLTGTDRDGQLAALDLTAQHGWRRFAAPIEGLALDAAGSVDVRCRALGVLSLLRPDGISRRVLPLTADHHPAELQLAAAQALADLQDAAVLGDLLASGPATANVQQAALARLLETTGGALLVLRWIDQDKLPVQRRAEALTKATAHPDANVRSLYERFIPEDQRPTRLGASIKPEEILALSGEAERGRRIFAESTAAGCKNCHTVDGKGGRLGPDLAQIGRKYERAALLETILDPSKAIAPEFVSYVLETDGGQLHAGFLIEKNEQEIVLRDAENRLVRVPAHQATALEPQSKSVMPELVLRDVTPQDAADLLAYLTTLKGPAPK